MIKIIRAPDPVVLQARINEYTESINDTHVVLGCSIAVNNGNSIIAAITVTELG